MPISPVDALRRETGVDASPELVRAVTAMSPDELGLLAEAVTTEPNGPVRTAPPRTEIWPVVSLRASVFESADLLRPANGPAGLNLNAALAPRFTGTGVFSDSVLRALLYCHGLVVENPLAAAAEMYLGTPRDQRPVARLALDAATASCVEIAPLLDARIVDTFFTPSNRMAAAHDLSAKLAAAASESGTTLSRTEAVDDMLAAVIDGAMTPSLAELGRRIRNGDRNPPIELVVQAAEEGDAEIVLAFLDALENFRPESVLNNTVEVIAHTVTAVENLGGFYDLLCPTASFARLLFLGSPDPAHELRLHELGRVAVPGIGGLLVTDAVRIRQGSAAFASWRSRLTEALEYAHRSRDDHREAADIDAGVRELIEAARAELHREARGTRVLNSANLWTFVAGALGGLLAGSPGGAPAMTSAATAGVLGALVQAVLRSTKVPGYLDRHYLVFEPPTA